MERRIPIEPEVLLSHAQWMRALALSLVNDAAAADDIVQESMVAALRRPPGSDRSLPAWLSRVVRNVASNLRRSEQRLIERHAQRGVGQADLDPSETLERLDTQRLIVDLVRELDEPLRSTIVLRYFEGLSSPEIGRRMGVNDATVRWRMQKALDELRARLQRKFGSRDAWCAMLMPFANSLKITTTAAAVASVTAGAVVMGTMSKVWIGAAALVVGAGLWLALDREQPAARIAEAAPLSKESEKLIEPVAPTASVREAIVPAMETAAVADPHATAAPIHQTVATEPNTTVRARFVDQSGQPWGNVLFRAADEYHPGEYPSSTTAGSDGRAELALSIPDDFRDPNYLLVATRLGCATRSTRVALVIGGVVDLGDVVLEREARVLGKVFDAQGNGLSDVTVGLLQGNALPRDPDNLRRRGPYDFDRMIIVTRSDARGAFELRGFPSGKWQLWGHRAGLGYGASELFEVKADEEKTGIDFEVPALLATDTISGVVLAPDGTPAPKAFVRFLWKTRHGDGSSGDWSQPDGRFEIVLNTDASGDLSAEDKERRLTSATAYNISPGARELVIQLAEMGDKKPARLRVHGPANEPVGAVKLMVLERTSSSGFTGHPQDAREIQAGEFEFQAPRVSFELTVSAEGYVDGTLKGLEPGNLPAELDIVLEVAPVLLGRVSAAGDSVSLALVEALSGPRTGQCMRVNGFPSFVSPMTSDSATSGADGKFTLKLGSRDRMPGKRPPLYLRCVAKGFAPTVVGPFDVDAMSDPIEIVLTLGGAIEGRARAKDGTTVAGAIVGVTCGDGHPRTMLSGRDGVFRFEGLSEGAWLVMQSDEEIGDITTTNSMRESHIDWSCTVAAGRTTYFDLTLNR